MDREKKKVTIKDIARLANVSTTAVSFVLNNHGGVSDETRQRILDVIEQTNFSPNVHTRRLNLNRSFNILLVMHRELSNLQMLFYMEIILGILDESKDLGYNVGFHSIVSKEDEELLLTKIRNKDTDGIIFIGDAEPRIVSSVEDMGTPFLVVDSHAPDTVDFPQVKTDYFQAATMAVNYLLEQGHEKIAFISMGSRPDYYFNTFEGYRDALAKANLSFEPNWIQSDATDDETAYECMGRILDSAKLPTAVFCAGDIFAIGAMKCVKERGLNIPEDISFIGLDNLIVSQYVDPPLTTVFVVERFMGQRAMRIMYDMISEKEWPKTTIASIGVVERESVKKM